MKNSSNKSESHKRISLLIPNEIHFKLLEKKAEDSLSMRENKPLSAIIIEAIQTGLKSA